jgi:hypothetical protein
MLTKKQWNNVEGIWTRQICVSEKMQSYQKQRRTRIYSVIHIFFYCGGLHPTGKPVGFTPHIITNIMVSNPSLTKHTVLLKWGLAKAYTKSQRL